jgi:hypothetical protein
LFLERKPQKGVQESILGTCAADEPAVSIETGHKVGRWTHMYWFGQVEQKER